MNLLEAIKQFEEWKGYSVKSNTLKGYNMLLRQFAIFMRNCDLEEVKLEHIGEFFSLLQLAGHNKNSFIPRAVALRKLFEYYLHQNFHVIDPWLIPLPRAEYSMPRVANEVAYSKLLNIIPENNDPRHIRNRAIIKLLWDTGARIGEVLDLNVSDINFEEKKAVIKTEKARTNRPIRELFWTGEAQVSLNEWLKKREHLKTKMMFSDPEALFISVMQGQYNTSGRRFTRRGAGEMLRRYCVRGGIEYLNAHSFRHHMGHDLAIKGANNSVISSILGHSSLQSSFVYTQLHNKELRSVYDKYKLGK